ncbi:MAG: hypothetical protein ABH879_01190 [archaeon]
MPITLKVPRVWIDPDKLTSPELEDLVLEVYGSFPLIKAEGSKIKLLQLF